MPRVQYNGDRERARSLYSEAMRQMYLLREAMKFQDLKQLIRRVTMTDGSIIVCSKVWGIETIQILGSPNYNIKPKVKKVEFCWCNACFARGIVTEVIGDYGDFGPFWKNLPFFDDGNQFYSKYCNTRYAIITDMRNDAFITRYEGIRYRVMVCQGELMHDREYICVSSDFAQYQVDDAVIVLLLGLWPNKTEIQNRDDPLYIDSFAACECMYYADIDATILCQACMGKNRMNWQDNEADGTYIILPFQVETVND
jgi:hypothetical protein